MSGASREKERPGLRGEREAGREWKWKRGREVEEDEAGGGGDRWRTGVARYRGLAEGWRHASAGEKETIETQERRKSSVETRGEKQRSRGNLATKETETERERERERTGCAFIPDSGRDHMRIEGERKRGRKRERKQVGARERVCTRVYKVHTSIARGMTIRVPGRLIVSTLSR